MKPHRMFPRLVQAAATLLLAFAAFESSGQDRVVLDGSTGMIPLASHGLAAEELQKNGLRAVNVAKGAIVFAVNSSVPMAGLTQAQVCDLFSGRVGIEKDRDGLVAEIKSSLKAARAERVL